MKLHHIWYDGWAGEFDLYGQALHDIGARKYALAGLGLIGCTPGMVSAHGTNGSCAEEQNLAAFNFNNKLKARVDQFNNDFYYANSKFIFINTQALAIELRDKYGNELGSLILHSTSLN